MQDGIKDFYDNLIKDGHYTTKDLGDEANFRQVLSQEGAMDQFFDNLVKDGHYTQDMLGGSKERFKEVLNRGSQEEAAMTDATDTTPTEDAAAKTSNVATNYDGEIEVRPLGPSEKINQVAQYPIDQIPEETVDDLRQMHKFLMSKGAAPEDFQAFVNDYASEGRAEYYNSMAQDYVKDYTDTYEADKKRWQQYVMQGKSGGFQVATALTDLLERNQVGMLPPAEKRKVLGYLKQVLPKKGMFGNVDGKWVPKKDEYAYKVHPEDPSNTLYMDDNGFVFDAGSNTLSATQDLSYRVRSMADDIDKIYASEGEEAAREYIAKSIQWYYGEGDKGEEYKESVVNFAFDYWSQISKVIPNGVKDAFEEAKSVYDSEKQKVSDAQEAASKNLDPMADPIAVSIGASSAASKEYLPERKAFEAGLAKLREQYKGAGTAVLNNAVMRYIDEFEAMMIDKNVPKSDLGYILSGISDNFLVDWYASMLQNDEQRMYSLMAKNKYGEMKRDENGRPTWGTAGFLNNFLRGMYTFETEMGVYKLAAYPAGLVARMGGKLISSLAGRSTRYIADALVKEGMAAVEAEKMANALTALNGVQRRLNQLVGTYASMPTMFATAGAIKYPFEFYAEPLRNEKYATEGNPEGYLAKYFMEQQAQGNALTEEQKQSIISEAENEQRSVWAFTQGLGNKILRESLIGIGASSKVLPAMLWGYGSKASGKIAGNLTGMAAEILGMTTAGYMLEVDEQIEEQNRMRRLSGMQDMNEEEEQEARREIFWSSLNDNAAFIFAMRGKEAAKFTFTRPGANGTIIDPNSIWTNWTANIKALSRQGAFERSMSFTKYDRQQLVNLAPQLAKELKTLSDEALGKTVYTYKTEDEAKKFRSEQVRRISDEVMKLMGNSDVSARLLQKVLYRLTGVVARPSLASEVSTELDEQTGMWHVIAKDDKGHTVEDQYYDKEDDARQQEKELQGEMQFNNLSDYAQAITVADAQANFWNWLSKEIDTIKKTKSGSELTDRDNDLLLVPEYLLAVSAVEGEDGTVTLDRSTCKYGEIAKKRKAGEELTEEELQILDRVERAFSECMKNSTAIQKAKEEFAEKMGITAEQVDRAVSGHDQDDVDNLNLDAQSIGMGIFRTSKEAEIAQKYVEFLSERAKKAGEVTVPETETEGQEAASEARPEETKAVEYKTPSKQTVNDEVTAFLEGAEMRKTPSVHKATATMQYAAQILEQADINVADKENLLKITEDTETAQEIKDAAQQYLNAQEALSEVEQIVKDNVEKAVQRQSDHLDGIERRTGVTADNPLGEQTGDIVKVTIPGHEGAFYLSEGEIGADGKVTGKYVTVVDGDGVPFDGKSGKTKASNVTVESVQKKEAILEQVRKDAEDYAAFDLENMRRGGAVEDGEELIDENGKRVKVVGDAVDPNSNAVIAGAKIVEREGKQEQLSTQDIQAMRDNSVRAEMDSVRQSKQNAAALEAQKAEEARIKAEEEAKAAAAKADEEKKAREEAAKNVNANDLVTKGDVIELPSEDGKTKTVWQVLDITADGKYVTLKGDHGQFKGITAQELKVAVANSLVSDSTKIGSLIDLKDETDGSMKTWEIVGISPDGNYVTLKSEDGKFRGMTVKEYQKEIRKTMGLEPGEEVKVKGQEVKQEPTDQSDYDKALEGIDADRQKAAEEAAKAAESLKSNGRNEEGKLVAFPTDEEGKTDFKGIVSQIGKETVALLEKNGANRLNNAARKDAEAMSKTLNEIYDMLESQGGQPGAAREYAIKNIEAIKSQIAELIKQREGIKETDPEKLRQALAENTKQMNYLKEQSKLMLRLLDVSGARQRADKNFKGIVDSWESVEWKKAAPQWSAWMDALAKKLGVKISFNYGLTDSKGVEINGVNHTDGDLVEVNYSDTYRVLGGEVDITPEERRKTIVDYLASVMGHELTHGLFNADKDLMKDFVQATKDYLGDKYEEMKLDKKSDPAYKNKPDEEIDEEISCDMAGQLFADAEFVKRLLEPKKVKAEAKEEVKPVNEEAELSRLEKWRNGIEGFFKKVLDFTEDFTEPKAEGKETKEKEAKPEVTPEMERKQMLQGLKDKYDIAFQEAAEKISPTLRRESQLEDAAAKGMTDDPTSKLSARQGPEPTKTMDVYKLVRIDEDGNLHPLFIDRNDIIPQHQWQSLDSPRLEVLKQLPNGIHLVEMNNPEGKAIPFEQYAEEHGRYYRGKLVTRPGVEDIKWAKSQGLRFVNINDTKVKDAMRKYGQMRTFKMFGLAGENESVAEYALRAGWHAGTQPQMRQIGAGRPGTEGQGDIINKKTGERGRIKDMRNDDEVWVKGRINLETDFTEQLNMLDTGQMESDGGYKYTTNAVLRAKELAARKKAREEGTELAEGKGIGWWLSTDFIVDKILSDDEARAIIDKHNRETGDNLEYDFEREGGRKFYADTMRVEEPRDKFSARKEKAEAPAREKMDAREDLIKAPEKAVAKMNVMEPDADVQDVETTRSGEVISAINEEAGQAMFSSRTYEEGGRAKFRDFLDSQVDKYKKTKGKQGISEGAARKMRKQMEEMYDEAERIRQEGNFRPYNEWSISEVDYDGEGNPVFSVIKANGDYDMNLDFSLLCKKRRTLDAVLNEMIERGIIDQADVNLERLAFVNDIIRAYGFETACKLCFVDARRFRTQEVSETFCTMWNDMVKAMIPEGSDIEAASFNFANEGGVYQPKGNLLSDAENAELSPDTMKRVEEVRNANTNASGKPNGDNPDSVPYKIWKHLMEHPEDRKLLRVGDFMSTRGFDAVKAQNKAVLSLYNQKKGTGGPKASFGDVQYLNDIATMVMNQNKNGKWTPEKAYAVGGVRIQSFSDYVPHLFFDYVQMIGDLAAGKFPGHAYTKEKDFVYQFGLTGLKINMSLVPMAYEKEWLDSGRLVRVRVKNEKGDWVDKYQWADGSEYHAGLDENGNYLWQEGETFDYDTAIAIQNAKGYRDNCGTIAVGISDEHIRKMLADPNIRMVIPYHKSGLPPQVALHNAIEAFVDYTDSQTTKGPDSIKDSDARKEWVKKHEPSFNTLMREYKSAERAAKEYIKWCNENGCTPKFAQFLEKGKNGKYKYTDGYYKLLEDFTCAVPDGKGGIKYKPQRAIQMRFPKEGDAFGSMSKLIREGLEADTRLEEGRDALTGDMVDVIEQSMMGRDKGLPEREEGEDLIDYAKRIAAMHKQEKGITQDKFSSRGEKTVRDEAGNTETVPDITDKKERQEYIIGEGEKLVDKAFSSFNDDQVKFSIRGRRKDEMRAVIRNRRPDLSDGDIRNQIDAIEAFGEETGNGGNPKLEKAATYWVANGTLTFHGKDDQSTKDNIRHALRICEVKKIDPFAYKNPLELIQEYSDVQMEKTLLDPRTVKEFTFQKKFGDYEIFVVEDSREGQKAVRRMIDSHMGEDANPWCIAARDHSTGDFYDSAWSYWNDTYNGVPKRIALKNGVLVAMNAQEPTYGSDVEANELYGTDEWLSLVEGCMEYGEEDENGDVWMDYEATIANVKRTYGDEVASCLGKDYWGEELVIEYPADLARAWRMGGYEDLDESEMTWWDRTDSDHNGLLMTEDLGDGKKGEKYMTADGEPTGDDEYERVYWEDKRKGLTIDFDVDDPDEMNLAEMNLPNNGGRIKLQRFPANISVIDGHGNMLNRWYYDPENESEVWRANKMTLEGVYQGRKEETEWNSDGKARSYEFETAHSLSGEEYIANRLNADELVSFSQYNVRAAAELDVKYTDGKVISVKFKKYGKTIGYDASSGMLTIKGRNVNDFYLLEGHNLPGFTGKTISASEADRILGGEQARVVMRYIDGEDPHTQDWRDLRNDTNEFQYMKEGALSMNPMRWSAELKGEKDTAAPEKTGDKFSKRIINAYNMAPEEYDKKQTEWQRLMDRVLSTRSRSNATPAVDPNAVIPFDAAKLSKNEQACKLLDADLTEINKKPLSREDLLNRIATAFGQKMVNGHAYSEDPFPVVTDEKKGKLVYVRNSDHHVQSANFKKNSASNRFSIGFVLQDTDKSSAEFRDSKNVPHVELFYYDSRIESGDPEKDKAFEIQYVEGIKHYLTTGSFAKMPLPDQCNTSGLVDDIYNDLVSRGRESKGNYSTEVKNSAFVLPRKRIGQAEDKLSSRQEKPLTEEQEKALQIMNSGKADVTKTDNFKRWFGDWEKDPENASKVVDKKGRPLVVHHGTDSYGFTVFNTSKEWNSDNVGSHFGAKNTAKEFGDKMYNVYLDIKKPWDAPFDFFADNYNNAYLEAIEYLRKEVNNSNVDIIADRVKDIYPHIPKNVWDRVKSGEESYSDVFEEDEYLYGQDTSHFKEDRDNLVTILRDMLEAAGYDGIRYQNWYEGDDHNICWVALEPNQVKSADTKGKMANNGDFSKDNPDIRYSARKTITTEDGKKFPAYGAPYSGSKNHIADKVIEALPAGERIVDLFAGGGAVTHAAMLSGKYKSYHMNDKNPNGMDLFMGGINGDFLNYNKEITPETFADVKGTSEGLLWSRNNANRQFRGDRINSGLARVNALNQLKEYKDQISTSVGDYKDVEIKPGDVLYADIPYEGTDNSAYKAAGKFDWREFEDWARNLDHPVYVSSKEDLDGFTEIARWNVQDQKHNIRVEKLLVQDKFAPTGTDGDKVGDHDDDGIRFSSRLEKNKPVQGNDESNDNYADRLKAWVDPRRVAVEKGEALPAYTDDIPMSWRDTNTQEKEAYYVNSARELTDDDFLNYSRSVLMPAQNGNLLENIGAENKGFLIKRGVFAKNAITHPDLSPEDSRQIINDALSTPDLVAINQPVKRPDYKVAVHLAEKNAFLVLDVYNGKNNVELISWRYEKEKGLKKLGKQIIREGGQVLILSPKGGAAAALSALPDELISIGKGTNISATTQINSRENASAPENSTGKSLVDSENPDIRYSSRMVDGEAARAQLVQEIRDMVDDKSVSAMKRSDLNRMLTLVKNASDDNLLESIDRAQRVVRGIKTEVLGHQLDELLKLKVQDRNNKGMSIAKNVDNVTRQLVKDIQGRFYGVMRTEEDKAISAEYSKAFQLRRDINGLDVQLKRGVEYLADDEGFGQEQPLTDARRHEMEQEMLDKQDELRKAYQSIAELRKSRKATVTSQVRDTLEGLQAKIDKKMEYMDKCADPDSPENWKADDTRELTELEVMKARMEIEQVDDQLNDLRHDRVQATRKAVREGLDTLIDEMERQRLEKVQNLVDMVQDIINGGKQSLANQKAAEIQHKSELITGMMGDIRGLRGKKMPADPDKAQKRGTGSTIAALFTGPLKSFEYMAHAIDRNHMSRDGWFYKHFVEGPDGVMAANSSYLGHYSESMKQLRDKTAEIFGKEAKDVAEEGTKRVTDHGITLLADDEDNRMPLVGIWGPDKDGEAIPFSKNNATYLWMVWQMADGRAKMENMGFDEISMEQIRDFIGEQRVQWADWIQKEYLPGLFPRYQEKYIEIYGTPMADIENYVPLRIDDTQIKRDSNMQGDQVVKNAMSQKNGFQINRTVNLKPVSLVADCFDVIQNHIQEAEEFNAFATVRKDLDTIFSSNAVINQLNANSAGSARDLQKAAQIAVRSDIHEDVNAIERGLIKMTKGIVGGNIAYRIGTAIKQMLSAPVFYAYTSDPVFLKHITKSLGKNFSLNLPGVVGGIFNKEGLIERADKGLYAGFSNDFRWALDNIPSFKDRVTRGTMGMDILDADTGKEGSFEKIFQKYLNKGMAANQLIDAVTCVSGIKAIYDYEMERNAGKVADGTWTQEQAENYAKTQADIFYNGTQQSSHGAFMSPVQMSKHALPKAFMAYQNASVGFARKAMENLSNLMKAAHRQDMLDTYTQSYMMMGKTEDEARKMAEADYGHRIRKSIVQLGMFGFLANFLWDLGGKGLYGLYMNDDQEDDLVSLTNIPSYLFRGTPGVNVMSQVLNGDVKSPLLFYEEMRSNADYVKKLTDKYGVMSPQLMEYALVKAARIPGVDLEVMANVYLGLEDLALSGFSADRDAALMLDTEFIINLAKGNRQSTAKQIYKDMPLDEQAKIVLRAGKVFESDDWRRWLPGARELTKAKYDQIMSELARQRLTDEELKQQPMSEKEMNDVVKHLNSDDDARDAYNATTDQKLRKKILTRVKQLSKEEEFNAATWAERAKKYADDHADKEKKDESKTNKGKRMFKEMLGFDQTRSDQKLDEQVKAFKQKYEKEYDEPLNKLLAAERTDNQAIQALEKKNDHLISQMDRLEELEEQLKELYYSLGSGEKDEDESYSKISEVRNQIRELLKKK